jgi:HAD superfamily phosphatase (TIGR01681 family)
MKKYIIFDFDGTLVDVLHIVEDIFKKIVKKYGYGDITDKEIESLRSMDAIEIIRSFKFPIWKIPKLSKAVRKQLAERANETKPFKHIKELLATLKSKGFKLAILTTNKKSTVKSILKINNINYFDAIESSGGIFNKSKYIIRFLKKNNLKNEDVVYIGDEIRDIKAAQDVGIEIIAVTWGLNKRDVLEKNNPDYLVDKPSQIFKVLTT